MKNLGPITSVLVVLISTVFLIYFGVCGFYNIIPFNHAFIQTIENSTCGESELQIDGYCCKSVEQYNTGSCIK